MQGGNGFLTGNILTENVDYPCLPEVPYQILPRLCDGRKTCWKFFDSKDNKSVSFGDVRSLDFRCDDPIRTKEQFEILEPKMQKSITAPRR